MDDINFRELGSCQHAGHTVGGYSHSPDDAPFPGIGQPVQSLLVSRESKGSLFVEHHHVQHIHAQFSAGLIDGGLSGLRRIGIGL